MIHNKFFVLSSVEEKSLIQRPKHLVEVEEGRRKSSRPIAIAGINIKIFAAAIMVCRERDPRKKK